jgi:hypothetical protein
MQHKLLIGRSAARGLRKPGLVGFARKPTRRAVSARQQVLRELLDDAHARIRMLERAIGRLTSKL